MLMLSNAMPSDSNEAQSTLSIREHVCMWWYMVMVVSDLLAAMFCVVFQVGSLEYARKKLEEAMQCEEGKQAILHLSSSDWEAIHH